MDEGLVVGHVMAAVDAALPDRENERRDEGGQGRQNCADERAEAHSGEQAVADMAGEQGGEQRNHDQRCDDGQRELPAFPPPCDFAEIPHLVVPGFGRTAAGRTGGS